MSIHTRSAGLDLRRPDSKSGTRFANAMHASGQRSMIAGGSRITAGKSVTRSIAATIAEAIAVKSDIDRSDSLQRERRGMFAIHVAHAVFLSERSSDPHFPAAFHKSRIAGQRGNHSSN